MPDQLGAGAHAGGVDQGTQATLHGAPADAELRGHGGDAAVAATQRLDMRTGEWEVGPDLPQARYLPGMVATDTALYVLGGRPDSGTQTDRVDRLDTARWPRTWAQPYRLPRAAAPLAGCTESLTGGELWAVGNPEVWFRPLDGERCDAMAGDVPWLSGSATSATIRPDSSVSVTLTVDAGDLSPGTHHATVLVRTDDRGAAEVRVPSPSP
jgi:hypothetical protein